MNETWDNSKKPSFGPPIFFFFFHGFYLNDMLDIVASYHYIQFQEKLMNKTWENGKKPSFGNDFAPFGPKIFFMNFTSTTC